MAVILPSEVVSIILANLGKADLLNCRTVSSEWNQECLRLLERSNVCIRLSEKNICEFVKFARKCVSVNSEVAFRLPFHLELNLRDYQDKECLTKMEPFLAGMEALVTLFGSTCVRSAALEFDTYHSSYFQVLVKVLAKICTGLESLDFTKTKLWPRISLEWARELFKLKGIRFPKIRKFKCRLAECSMVNEHHTIYCPLLEICPNVEIISFKYQYSPCYLSIPFQTLTTLKLDYFDARNLLKAILKSPTVPRIRKLKLGDYIFGNAAEYTEIVASFSQSLVTLNIFWNSQVHHLFRLPRLPILKDLKISQDKRLPKSNYKSEISLSDMNFNSYTLPSLTSFDIPSTCELTLRTPTADNHVGEVVFPGVKNITLRSSNCLFRGNPIHMHYVPDKPLNKMLEVLVKIFPNSPTISILNTCKYGKPHATFMLRSDAYPTIERIELLGCDAYYVRNLLENAPTCREIILKKFPRKLSLEIELRNLIKDHVINLDSSINITKGIAT